MAELDEEKVVTNGENEPVPAPKGKRGQKGGPRVVKNEEGEEGVRMSTDDYREFMDGQKKMFGLVGDLKDQLDALTSNSKKPSNILKRVNERIISLRVWEGKLVIGFKNVSEYKGKEKFVYSRPDPNNPKEQIEFVQLILDGADEPVEVQYVPFLQGADSTSFKVEEIKRTPIEIDLGYIDKKILDNDGYNMVSTNVLVPNIVTQEKLAYVIRKEDGTLATVPEQIINM